MPEKEARFSNIIRNTNTDYEYMFWDSVPHLPERLQKLCDRFTKRQEWVKIADLLRYFVVREYGGLYIDCDYEQINRLESLNFEKYRGFLPLHFNPGETICNSVFGFEKNHPIIENVCSDMESLEEESPWLGPHFFGNSIKQCLGKDTETFDIHIDELLWKQGIKTMHSRGEFKIHYLHHHYSYNWHPENQQKLIKNEES